MALPNVPMVLVNGYNISNGVTHILYVDQCKGLFEPAVLENPAEQNTFGGRFLEPAQPTDYKPRKLVLKGRITRQADFMSKQAALAKLGEVFSGSPAVVEVGSLRILADFGEVVPVDDSYKRLAGDLTWEVEGYAIPATWEGVYSRAVGVVQGITINDDRVNSSYVMFDSNPFTFKNPGTAPTAGEIVIYGLTAGLTIYFKNTHALAGGIRVAATADSAGFVKVTEADGLLLYPGDNPVRVEDAAGALYSNWGRVWAYGTPVQYLGNTANGNSQSSGLPTSMMAENKPLDFHRTGSKTYVSTAGTLSTATDGQPAIGLPYVVRRNLFSSSQDLSTWSTIGGASSALGQTAPDGASTAALITDSGGTLSGINRTSAGWSPSNSQWVASVYVKKGTSRYAAYEMTLGGGTVQDSIVIVDLDTGAVINSATYPSDSVGSQSVGNGWYRIWVVRTDAGNNTNASFSAYPAWSNGLTPGYIASQTGSIYVWGPQFERGSAPTPYQPTNASGVDLTHPINGAGLTLEVTGTNMLANSGFEAGVLTGWNIDANGAAGLGSYNASTNPVYGGTYSGRMVTTAGQNVRFYQQPTMINGQVYTITAKAIITSYTSGAPRVYFSAGSVFANLPLDTTKIGQWQEVTATITSNGTAGLVELSAAGAYGTAGAIEVFFDCVQVEPSPFRTSYIDNPATSGAATRQPDLCGIVPPHNLLKYSEQLDKWTAVSGPAITINNVMAPNNIQSADYVDGSSSEYAGVESLGIVTPGKTYTFSWWVRPASGVTRHEVNIYFNGGGSTARAYIEKLTPLVWQRVSYTFTVPSTSTEASCRLLPGQNWWAIVRQSAHFWGAQLVEGSHPGPYVPTTDTAIPAPVSPVFDPAWSQNGAVEFEVVLPPISTGKQLNVFGRNTSAVDRPGLSLVRESNRGLTDYILTIWGKHNGSIGQDGVAGRTRDPVYVPNIWDGARHRIRLEWFNYMLDGVRYMPVYIWVDGTRYQGANMGDAAKVHGASAWTAPDFSVLVSDGNVYATLSDLRFDYPILPDNAVVTD